MIKNGGAASQFVALRRLYDDDCGGEGDEGDDYDGGGGDDCGVGYVGDGD